MLTVRVDIAHAANNSDAHAVYIHLPSKVYLRIKYLMVLNDSESVPSLMNNTMKYNKL